MCLALLWFWFRYGHSTTQTSFGGGEMGKKRENGKKQSLVLNKLQEADFSSEMGENGRENIFSTRSERTCAGVAYERRLITLLSYRNNKFFEAFWVLVALWQLDDRDNSPGSVWKTRETCQFTISMLLTIAWRTVCSNPLQKKNKNQLKIEFDGNSGRFRVFQCQHFKLWVDGAKRGIF